MGRSILGLVGLGATLVFALPAVLLGVEFLLRGEYVWGTALVTIAGLMILGREYITTPGDLPGMVADQTVGRIAKTDDEE